MQLCWRRHCVCMHFSIKHYSLRLLPLYLLFSCARLAFGVHRLSKFNSRAIAVLRKNDVVAARAWRAAEAGRLRLLPQSSSVWRLTWRQLTMRCMSSGHAM